MKALLDRLAEQKNSREALFSHPDPLQVVYEHLNSDDIEFIALLCALFAYGNAGAIVRFLRSLDFSLLNASEAKIKKCTSYYRFQSPSDCAQIFITLRRLKNECSIKEFSENYYRQNRDLLALIQALISKIYSLNPYRSRGYEFFFAKLNRTSAYKRYCMYFRWMVRSDGLDLGRFSAISPADLLMPLDTHTHKMALRLGLIARKIADQKAMLELTSALKALDANDPLKYDFALYRISQTSELASLCTLLDKKS